MDKNQYRELHKNLLKILDAFIKLDRVDRSDLKDYEELNVRPSHDHKPLAEHKQAVFLLGNVLAEAMSEDEFSNASRIAKQLDKLADEVD